MKAQKRKNNDDSNQLKCNHCRVPIYIPKLIPTVNRKKHLSIGLNAYLLPKPVFIKEGALSLDRFQVFCLDCYNKGVFFQRFNEINKDHYQQQQSRLLQMFRVQYHQDYQRLQNYNFYLQMKEKEIERMNKVIAEELQKQQDEHQIVMKYLDSLKSDLKAITKLQDKLNSFVLAAEKFNSVRQISQILSQIDETTQKQNSYAEDFIEIHREISQILEEYTEYELDLTARSEEGQEKDNQFFYHEDELNYHYRTYNINHSFLASLKNQLKTVEKLIQEKLAVLKNRTKNIEQIRQIAVQAPVINQQVEEFAVMLECSGCQRSLFINKLHYKKVAPSHFKIGINFYIFNSPHPSLSSSPSETFQAFCTDCFHKQAYVKKFKQIWPLKKQIIDTQAQVQVKESKKITHVVNQFIQPTHFQQQIVDSGQQGDLSNLRSIVCQIAAEQFQNIVDDIYQEKVKKSNKVTFVEPKNVNKIEEAFKQALRQKHLEQKRKEKEARKKAKRLIKKLQLEQRLSGMWFLEEGELEGIRQQALANQEFMDLVISQGNLLFNYPNQSLMGTYLPQGQEDPDYEQMYDQDYYTKLILQNNGQVPQEHY